MKNQLSGQVQKSIDRGVDWILKQRDAKTGGWHPDTYGAMRGGASATSLALYMGAQLPKRFRQRPEWKQSLEFLLQGIGKRNCIACPDGTLDYPTYSTALTLIATRRLSLAMAETHRTRLVAYLISAQLTEANGFTPDNIDYGGWDLLGGSGAEGFTSGTNISVSYFAVQALAGEKHADRDSTIKNALAWVKRCQNFGEDKVNLDGGFFFHPTKKALGNKARWKDSDVSRPRSYGSPTCDGIGLLTAGGMNAKAEEVRSAVAWLDSQRSVSKVPGFKDAPKEAGWDDGLKFYYWMGLSRTLPLLPEASQKKCRQSLAEEILSQQKKDGSWQNESDRMREDDPHIATCFALIAMSKLQTSNTR